MFDAGFLELIVIGVLALVIVGPERLPGIARKVGKWVGKARALVQSTKSDIERELRADELRNMLIMQEEKIRDLQSTVENSVNTTSQKIDDVINRETSDVENRIAPPAQKIKNNDVTTDATTGEKNDTASK